MFWILAQTPDQDQGITISSDTMQSAIRASEMFVNSFERDWTDMVSGTSPIYGAVIHISTLIAVVLVTIWALQWYQMFLEEGFSSRVLSELVMPVLVILLLSGNGALMSKCTLALRQTTVNLNRDVLAITRNGVTLKDAIRTMNFDQNFTFSLQVALAECEKLPQKEVDENGIEFNPRRNCRERTITAAKEEALKIRQQQGLGAGGWLPNPAYFVREIVNNLIQVVVFVIFSGLTAAFQYTVQLSFLLVAYVAPIFLALSLLPASNKAIYAWLSGWAGLTLLLLSYSIIVGISASSIVNSPSTDPILSQLIIAVLSPVLAVAIGIGSGMAVFSAFASGIRFVAGIRG